MKTFEVFLNKTTMYRLVLYALIFIAIYAFVLSYFGILSLNPLGLFASFTLLLVSCFITQVIFSKIYGSTTSTESIWITAFILFLTIAPPVNITEGTIIFLAGIFAITSKYIFSINRKHIFNPAAITLLMLSLSNAGLSAWWVGSVYMLPAIVFVGYFIVKKIHRFDTVISFIVTAFLTTTLFGSQGTEVLKLNHLIFSGPLIFFASIMLTEPLTLPPTKFLRIVYGIIVGGFYASSFNFGILFSTPHLALIIGNIYSYIVSAKQRVVLRLDSIEQLSKNVYEFVFKPSEKLFFKAGQYLEWTLPYNLYDKGGNRRYFTIASSPLESNLRIGLRIDEHASKFKRSLLSMNKNDIITAASLSGDFVLPKDTSKKLFFIAGGVGITPFISMIRYLHDKLQFRDIVLVYIVSRNEDLAYGHITEEVSKNLGIKVIYVVGKKFDIENIHNEVPDFKDRMYYISGPDGMVAEYKRFLKYKGIKGRKIKTDYFTGFTTI